MKLVCLDLEGVLLPEVWQELSKKTGIEKLMLTTRDVANYDELMQMRLKILEENNLGIEDVKEVIASMEPLEGASEFLNWLKERAQVVILTGSYYEYIMPLMEKLGYPCMFANSLKIEDGKIVGYNLREEDGKIEMINRFHDAKMETIAIGDSNNDLSMLKGAGKGIFFRAPEKIKEANPELEFTNTYEELKEVLEKYL
jgi:phosphoserine / homoserine phosphotransferase